MSAGYDQLRPASVKACGGFVNLRTIKVTTTVNREESVKVQYKGIVAGNFRLDFLVDDRVVVELKAVEQLSDIHAAQVISYLAATEKKVGLLLNFARQRLKDGGIKRVIL